MPSVIASPKPRIVLNFGKSYKVLYFQINYFCFLIDGNYLPADFKDYKVLTFLPCLSIVVVCFSSVVRKVNKKT